MEPPTLYWGFYKMLVHSLVFLESPREFLSEGTGFTEISGKLQPVSKSNFTKGQWHFISYLGHMQLFSLLTPWLPILAI